MRLVILMRGNDIMIKQNGQKTMKQLTIVMMTALLFAGAAFADGPIAFKDYKKLAPDERQLLVQKVPAGLQKQYERWDKIINLAGKWWAGRDSTSWAGRETAVWAGLNISALIEAKGLNQLRGLLGVQETIWGCYEFQQDPLWREGRPVIVAPALAAEVSERDKEAEIDDWYLVKLAPTSQAYELNKKAGTLGEKWAKRFIGKPPGIITRKDLAALDADVKQIRDEMRKLPLWTPEEVEEAFAALPVQEKLTR
jgi:hypothetical protein